MKNKILILLCGVVLIVLLVLLRLSRPSHYNATKNIVDLSEQAQQELAQSYFRLGVATAQSVILKHQLAGERIPEPKTLLKECIDRDIEDSNGETLLKRNKDLQ